MDLWSDKFTLLKTKCMIKDHNQCCVVPLQLKSLKHIYEMQKSQDMCGHKIHVLKYPLYTVTSYELDFRISKS